HHLEACQHAIVVAIEPRERFAAARPFPSRDAAVMVHVERVEACRRVTVEPLFAQELPLAHDSIVVAIDTPKRIVAIAPFLTRDAAVAIVVETIERLRGPVGRFAAPLVAIDSVVAVVSTPPAARKLVA